MLLPLLMIIHIILAFIGAVLAILTGSVFIKRVTSANVHVLQKRGLASDFIVADLDARNMKCTRNVHPNEDLDLESNQFERGGEVPDPGSVFEIDSSTPTAPLDHSE